MELRILKSVSKFVGLNIGFGQYNGSMKIENKYFIDTILMGSNMEDSKTV